MGLLAQHSLPSYVLSALNCYLTIDEATLNFFPHPTLDPTHNVTVFMLLVLITSSELNRHILILHICSTQTSSFLLLAVLSLFLSRLHTYASTTCGTVQLSSYFDASTTYAQLAYLSIYPAYLHPYLPHFTFVVYCASLIRYNGYLSGVPTLLKLLRLRLLLRLHLIPHLRQTVYQVSSQYISDTFARGLATMCRHVYSSSLCYFLT